jgi:hypothetical protein
VNRRFANRAIPWMKASLSAPIRLIANQSAAALLVPKDTVGRRTEGSEIAGNQRPERSYSQTTIQTEGAQRIVVLDTSVRNRCMSVASPHPRADSTPFPAVSYSLTVNANLQGPSPVLTWTNNPAGIRRRSLDPRSAGRIHRMRAILGRVETSHWIKRNEAGETSAVFRDD